MKQLINKIKTIALFTWKEALAILAVAMNKGLITNFHQGIFESRVLFETLFNKGIQVRSFAENTISQINYTDKKLIALLRRKSSDAKVFEQIFLKEEYKEFLVFIEAHSNSEIKTIIDGGANVGYATLYFKAQFPQSQIYCLEPETDNFGLLEKNIKINKLENVFPIKAGVWKRDTNLALSMLGSDVREWSFTVEETDNVNNSIRGISIPSLIETYNIQCIDILKLDIEGSEKYLFEDLHLAEDFLKIVRFLAIEIHDENIEKPRIKNFLSKLNFIISDSAEYTIAFNRNLAS